MNKKIIFLLFFMKSPAKQSQFALEFFNRVLGHVDLSDESSLKLAYKLWNLSLKNQKFSKFHVIKK
jgi:hypothetical protein